VNPPLADTFVAGASPPLVAGSLDAAAAAAAASVLALPLAHAAPFHDVPLGHAQPTRVDVIPPVHTSTPRARRPPHAARSNVAPSATDVNTDAARRIER